MSVVLGNIPFHLRSRYLEETVSRLGFIVVTLELVSINRVIVSNTMNNNSKWRNLLGIIKQVVVFYRHCLDP